MGMTDGQVLRQVELPAAGVIVTGIRVATVIAVGVTTIAAAVGAGGLGVYIFGLRQYDNNFARGRGLGGTARPWRRTFCSAWSNVSSVSKRSANDRSRRSWRLRVNGIAVCCRRRFLAVRKESYD